MDIHTCNKYDLLNILIKTNEEMTQNNTEEHRDEDNIQPK